MKILQTNNDQLEINESGVSSIVVGIIFAVGGIVTSLWPFFVKGTPWWVSLIGLVIIGVGGLVISSASSSHTVLRRTGASEITKTKIIGGKTNSRSFDASQVASVGLETRTEYSNNSSDNGGSTRQRVSTLFILLKDNSEFVIATSKNGGGGLAVNGINLSSFGKAPLSEEATQIATLFNVPLSTQNRGEMGLEDVTRAVSTIAHGLTGNTEPQTPLSVTPSQEQPIVQQPSAQQVTPIGIVPPIVQPPLVSQDKPPKF